MNTKSIKVITTLVKIASVVAGLAAYADLVPAKYAPIAVIVFGVASAAKDLFVKTGDLLDDGQANGSFKG